MKYLSLFLFFFIIQESVHAQGVTWPWCPPPKCYVSNGGQSAADVQICAQATRGTGLGTGCNPCAITECKQKNVCNTCMLDVPDPEKPGTTKKEATLFLMDQGCTGSVQCGQAGSLQCNFYRITEIVNDAKGCSFTAVPVTTDANGRPKTCKMCMIYLLKNGESRTTDKCGPVFDCSYGSGGSTGPGTSSGSGSTGTSPGTSGPTSGGTTGAMGGESESYEDGY